MTYTIEEIKKRTIPIAKKHKVKSIGIFGSYAKNKATDTSDLDFIMEDGEVNSLIKYMALVNDLEEEFNCHVDLVSSYGNNNAFLKRIEKDVIVIYNAF